MPVAPSKWLPEHDEMLKALIAAGELSHEMMARQINAAFGTRYSRNSTIGRSSRLGIRGEKPPKPAVTAHVVRKRSPRPRIRPPAVPRIPPAQIAALACEAIVPLGVLLEDIRPTHCRWPYGETTPYVFCGHPQLADRSYCAAHYALSTREQPK